MPDVRVLAGIADELGRPTRLPHAAGRRAELDELGPWDGERAGDVTDAVLDGRGLG